MTSTNLTLVSRDRFYQRPNVSSLQVFIVEDKTDFSPKVLDEHKTIDDEDPYRALKIVNSLYWLVVLIIIGIMILPFLLYLTYVLFA
tara:strand:- start:53 stop:313 length:261 start_codon:yes stop_codon:yes gene_type:complete